MIHPIATFHSPLSEKFGIPRQSGVVADLPGFITFEPPYRNADYLRGLEDYDYLWLIWQFSANSHAATSPLVRPPLLGGNEKRGVFATRSPYRPNPIGLSSVRIARIETATAQGPVIHVLGADLMDGTPIYDIKPYLAYADSHPEACGGITDTHQWQTLQVRIPDEIAGRFTPSELHTLTQLLSQDPRPHYHDDPTHIYGLTYAHRNLTFTVSSNRQLEVLSIN